MTNVLPVPPSPPLSDGVIRLRAWTPDDADSLVACLDGEPEISRWIELIPQPYTREDATRFLADAARAWREGTGAPFAVVDGDSDAILSGIDVRWSAERDVGELGYWTRADARGRGVLARSLVLISRWAFGLPGVARLQLRAERDNASSRRVAEKAGFQLEGILRAWDWSERHQRRRDFAMYSLLPEDLEEDQR